MIFAPVKRLFFLLIFSYLCCEAVVADVVKPALVEINVDNERSIVVEVRASISG
jgi:hypothetical protein